MKLNSKANEPAFEVPEKVIDYLKGAKKSETKLILYIFSRKGEEFSVEEASKCLSETPECIMSSLAFWRGTGLISEVEESDDEENGIKTKAEIEIKKEESKEYSVAKSEGYSTEEIANVMQNDNEFKALVNYAEHILGTLLNPSRVSTLLYLYDTLGMQCDVLMGIIAHCVSNDKKSLRYIQRCAEGIHNDGVVTYKELEAYFASKRRYAEFESVVKRIIGATDRAFTSKEAKLVSVWQNTYKAKKELIEYAYEKCVSATSKPSIPYMSKILESWYNNGIDTIEKAKNLKQKSVEENKTASGSSFDFDISEIFEKP